MVKPSKMKIYKFKKSLVEPRNSFVPEIRMKTKFASEAINLD